MQKTFVMERCLAKLKKLMRPLTLELDHPDYRRALVNKCEALYQERLRLEDRAEAYMALPEEVWRCKKMIDRKVRTLLRIGHELDVLLDDLSNFETGVKWASCFEWNFCLDILESYYACVVANLEILEEQFWLLTLGQKPWTCFSGRTGPADVKAIKPMCLN